MPVPRHLMVVAGEASGDALGAALIAALQEQAGDRMRLSGVGGPLMAARGHESLFPMTELAVMGLAEVLPKIVPLRRRLLQTVDFAIAERPDALITIDAPGFCLRLAERVAGQGFPRIHYVAPQVWAWRPGRVHHIARVVDYLLCLFKFEPELFVKVGLDAAWVGHPVAESGIDRGDGSAFRARHGLAGEARILLLLPGSRAGEVGRLLPLFRETIGRLRDVTVVLPAASAVEGRIREMLTGWTVPHHIVGADQKAGAFAAADVALAASGTVTLELALAGVPSVVAYRVNPLTALIGAFVLRVPHAAMANILAGREAMPEFLQWKASPTALAGALTRLLDDAGAREQQRSALADIGAALAPPGPPPSAQAAAAVLRRLQEGQEQQ
ncbi:MAG: lipid-A-disaccharide synthase [Alphaproteobacteria bacterium]